MSLSPQRRGVRRLAAALTLTVGATLGGLAPVAMAAPDASTPVPAPIKAGEEWAYVVVGAPGQDLTTAVTQAGGTVVANHPEIGVAFAHSTDAEFLPRVRKAAGVEQAGPSRWTPVKGAERVLTASPSAAAAGSTGERGTRSLAHGADTPATTPASPTEPVPDQWDMRQIRADRAHDITRGKGAVVGILDSGVAADHPALAGRIDEKKSSNCSINGAATTPNLADEGKVDDHGTHVAGTIGGLAKSDPSFEGVAPEATLASIQVVNDDGFIYPEYAVCGMTQAVQAGVDVTNNSYYVDPFTYWCNDQLDQAPAREAVERATKWAQDAGIVTVAAAGNSATDLSKKTSDSTSPDDGEPVKRTVNDTCADIPTEVDGVVTVSAVDKDDKLAPFSNYGRGAIDIAAPGVQTWSSVPGDKYEPFSGTSMASPHVAGVAALIVAQHPDWTREQVIDRLTRSARALSCPTGTDGTVKRTPCTSDSAGGTQRVTADGTTSWFGHGVVDALAAVTEPATTSPAPVAPTPTRTPTRMPTTSASPTTAAPAGPTTAPATETSVPTPSPSSAAAPAPVPADSDLADTGAGKWIVPVIVIAAVAVVGGLALLLARRR